MLSDDEIQAAAAAAASMDRLGREMARQFVESFPCTWCGGAMSDQATLDWHKQNECLERPAPLAALHTFDEYMESETDS